MLPKPKHLSPEYGAQFQDPSIVAAYRHRPPYPAGVFAILCDLLPPGPRVVLDAGCGTGDIARPLAPFVERVDAVDLSAAMIAEGKTLPGGDHRQLRWIEGAMETVALAPPYALITAGESVHWMDWSVVFPRFRRLLDPGGSLALVGRQELPSPWSATLAEIIPRYSTNVDYQRYSVLHELQVRGLFDVAGERHTAPVVHRQSFASYVESIHSRNGLSRDRMPQEVAAAFDAEVRALLAPSCPDGVVEIQIAGRVTWGTPLLSSPAPAQITRSGR